MFNVILSGVFLKNEFIKFKITSDIKPENIVVAASSAHGIALTFDDIVAKALDDTAHWYFKASPSQEMTLFLSKQSMLAKGVTVDIVKIPRLLLRYVTEVKSPCQLRMTFVIALKLR